MMSRLMINAALLIALAVALGGNWVARSDTSQPNLEYFPDMAHSPRYNAFEENPNFADGKTLQAPPAGSIARGFLPLRYQATPKDALRAADELRAPPASSAGVERGRVVFANICRSCHGPGGHGDGAVARRGFPPPPSLLAGNAINMKDGQMFHIITFGQGNMPPHAAQVSREDRWNDMRSLQQRNPGGRP
jgi:mono/diheme cytochrome c family protein